MASILVRTVIIYLLLSFSLRIMGKRQLGELDVVELVSTLLISEIASIPIDDPDIPLLNAVIPILFILSAEVILSTIKNKSERLKETIEGKPVYLIYKGRLLESALRDNRISLNELLCSLREVGVFAPETVEYAILETNGKVSVLQKPSAVPPTTDMLYGKKDGGMSHPLIIDGEIQTRALYLAGKNEKWLQRYLKEENISPSQVFLLTINDDETIKTVKKEGV